MVTIKGEDLKGITDFAEGFGKTVEPLGDAAHNVMTGIADPIVHGFHRKARIVEFKEAEYADATDWTSGDDGAITVHASVQNAGVTVDLPEPIEFIHFGKVYRDDSHRFISPKLDDTKTGIALSQTGTGSTSDTAARGLMFRAALMRETVLLGGFIRAQMDALIAEEKSKGVVGILAQVLADLTGSSGGTEDKPSPVDLNPHIKKVIEAGKKINVAKVDYPAIHAAGIDLHTARKAYREYLVSELEKRQGKSGSSSGSGGGGAANGATAAANGTGAAAATGKGLLNQQVPKINEALDQGYKWWHAQDVVPKLTMIVPPEVQKFLSIVQKISFKAWDVYASLIYEYAIRLEPIIEDSCRNISISAIEKRATPMYPVWYMEPQTFPALPANLDQQIFDKIDNPFGQGSGLMGKVTDALNKAVDVVTDPVKGALQKYDQEVGIDKTLDFLSRPDAYTPGRPFLDDIFLIPPDPDEASDLPNGDKRARRGWSGGLGDLAVTCMKGALGLDSLPGFLEWIVSRVSTVAAEFVRGIYCRLLTLKDTDQITEDEIVEAAERHLVGNVIESILGGLRFVEQIRKEVLDFPIGHVALSFDALVGRAKEFASQKLDEFVAPVIKFAIRDLYGAIFAYRATAITNKAMTMEVHLAELPNLFARLFRNIFFPLWDKVLEKVLDSVTASLMPKVQEAAQKILHARDEVDKVRLKMTKGLAALESLPKTLPNVAFDPMHPKDSIDKIKKDWNPIVKNAKDAYDGASLHDSTAPSDALESSFPLPGRIIEAEALAVTDQHLATVHPNLKWKGKPVAPAVDDAAASKANGDGGSTKNSLGAPTAYGGELAATPSSQKQPMMMPFNYNDPLPKVPYSGQIANALPQMASLQNPLQNGGLGQAPISMYSGTAHLPPSSSVPNAAPHVESIQHVAPPSSHGFAKQPGVAHHSEEKTEQFQLTDPPAHHLDPEETVDLPGSALSVLLPFQGTKK